MLNDGALGDYLSHRVDWYLTRAYEAPTCYRGQEANIITQAARCLHWLIQGKFPPTSPAWDLVRSVGNYPRSDLSEIKPDILMEVEASVDIRRLTKRTLDLIRLCAYIIEGEDSPSLADDARWLGLVFCLYNDKENFLCTKDVMDE